MRLPPLSLLALALAFPAAVASASSAVSPDNSGRDAQLTAAVQDAIVQALGGPLPPPPPGADPGEPIVLLGARLAGERLELDFGPALLRYEPGSLAFETWFRVVHRAVGSVLDPALASYEVHTRIDGVALDRILERLDAPGNAAAHAAAHAPPPAGERVPEALAGRRIALSPGHGYTFNGTSWGLQRSYFFGIVEDFVNHDMITEAEALLRASGAIVYPLRELNRTAGNGESGFARWQEAARYHVKALGADPSVWNESGFTHLEQDIRCRPRYANAINAAVLVSLHNNGGGGTGTETLYDTNNTVAAESKRFADIVHAAVIGAIRRDFDPAWTDRRVKGFNGSYGENRLATRPSVILEIAFMDRQTPDNAALQQARFHRIVAQAIHDGVREYLEGPLTAPEAPEGLTATADATGITLAWADRSNREAGFRVERRVSGTEAWTALVPPAPLAANAIRYQDTTATVGVPYDYRVFALNAAGDSAEASNEVTAERPPARPEISYFATAPSAPLDWGQTAVFTITVSDASGSAVAGAIVSINDAMRPLPGLAVTTDAAGRATYRSTVPDGQADGDYSVGFGVSRAGYSPPVGFLSRFIRVARPEGLPGKDRPLIRSHPTASTGADGRVTLFPVVAATPGDVSYQWFRDGVLLPGESARGLSFTPSKAADSGSYTVRLSNAAGSVDSLPVDVRIRPTAWLSNVSVRTGLASGQTVIVGLVVRDGPRGLLLRAAGPVLRAFGLAGAMADPRLTLFRGADRVVANNDWQAGLAPTMAAVGAFAFPAASRDAALLADLEGAHTAHAVGTAGGIVLVEGYDAGSGGSGRVVNLSARNRVGTGDDGLITGFAVAGTGQRRVLIRAVGPTLAAFGVPGPLADPRLEIFDGSTRIAGNDDWTPELASAFAQVGAFGLPAGSRDAALVLTLPAGRAYTAQVTGGGATGEALVEVYELPEG
jgi:N-acetylmuramoyl-L-alanine amidase